MIYERMRQEPLVHYPLNKKCVDENKNLKHEVNFFEYKL